MPDFTVSPSLGSPRGGQVVTLTGTGFGTVLGAVSIDGNAATVTAWTDTSIACTVPGRYNSAGVLQIGKATVSVAVTPSTGPAQSGEYRYNGTLLEETLQRIRTRLGQVRIQDGAFFDIYPDQVDRARTDIALDTGANYPQIEVFAEGIQYGPDRADTYQHYHGPARAVVQACFPATNPATWTAEADLLLADLFRAVRRTQADIGGVANSIDVTGAEIGQLVSESGGAMTAVTLTLDIELEHIDNDMTTATDWSA